MEKSDKMVEMDTANAMDKMDKMSELQISFVGLMQMKRLQYLYDHIQQLLKAQI